MLLVAQCLSGVALWRDLVQSYGLKKLRTVLRGSFLIRFGRGEEKTAPIRAWIIDDTGISKKGKHSVFRISSPRLMSASVGTYARSRNHGEYCERLSRTLAQYEKQRP
jgi:hypothetical protein